MRLRFNPEPWSTPNASVARTSTAAEVAMLAIATAAGATVGALIGKTRTSTGIGAGIGFGIAVALVVTAEDSM
jgi:hypothetical protein